MREYRPEIPTIEDVVAALGVATRPLTVAEVAHEVYDGDAFRAYQERTNIRTRLYEAEAMGLVQEIAGKRPQRWIGAHRDERV